MFIINNRKYRKCIIIFFQAAILHAEENIEQTDNEDEQDKEETGEDFEFQSPSSSADPDYQESVSSSKDISLTMIDDDNVPTIRRYSDKEDTESDAEYSPPVCSAKRAKSRCGRGAGRERQGTWRR